MSELGRKGKAMSPLSSTHYLYIINPISLHQELSQLFVILPKSKKTKMNNREIPTTHGELQTQQKQCL